MQGTHRMRGWLRSIDAWSDGVCGLTVAELVFAQDGCAPPLYKRFPVAREVVTRMMGGDANAGDDDAALSVALASEAALVGALAPVRALMSRQVQTWLVRHAAQHRHCVVTLYHSAAWAVGEWGLDVLRLLWSQPVRHCLAQVGQGSIPFNGDVGAPPHSMKAHALGILDCAFSSMENAFTAGSTRAGMGILTGRLAWLVRAIGRRHAPARVVGLRLWTMAPALTRACLRSEGARGLGMRREHLVAGISAVEDLGFLCGVFGHPCVASALRKHAATMAVLCT